MKDKEFHLKLHFFFPCEGSQAPGQAAQRGCGVIIYGDIQTQQSTALSALLQVTLLWAGHWTGPSPEGLTPLQQAVMLGSFSSQSKERSNYESSNPTQLKRRKQGSAKTPLYTDVIILADLNQPNQMIRLPNGRTAFNLINTSSYSTELMLDQRELVQTGLTHITTGFRPLEITALICHSTQLETCEH